MTTKESVLARVARNPDLPTPPAIVLRVLEQASRPDCVPADLAKLIRLDPALSGKILRSVNSALFSLSQPIASIERALNLLGLKRVRSLVLSFSLPMMQRPAKVNPRTTVFWKLSVAGALVARALADTRGKSDPEDDLVAALLRGLGELVLRQEFPDAYRELDGHPPEVLAQQQCDLEDALLGCNHAEVGALMLKQWRLPEELTASIRYYCRPADTVSCSAAVTERAYVLHFAHRAAQTHLGFESSAIRQDLVEMGYARFGMSSTELDIFLDPLHKEIRKITACLNRDVGPHNCAAVLTGAMEELLKLTVELGLEDVRMRMEKEIACEAAERWRREANRDGLTRLFNRGFLEETLTAEFNRARRRGTPLGVLFIDLDGFKPLNDRFGHLFGDQILKEVGSFLLRTARRGDTVARFGGDEFCIIAADPSEIGLQALSQRIWQGINDIVVPHDKDIAKVGVSIGAVFCLPHRTTCRPCQLLEAADKAMYAAKAAGKNRVFAISL